MKLTTTLSSLKDCVDTLDTRLQLAKGSLHNLKSYDEFFDSKEDFELIFELLLKDVKKLANLL